MVLLPFVYPPLLAVAYLARLMDRAERWWWRRRFKNAWIRVIREGGRW